MLALKICYDQLNTISEKMFYWLYWVILMMTYNFHWLSYLDKPDLNTVLKSEIYVNYSRKK